MLQAPLPNEELPCLGKQRRLVVASIQRRTSKNCVRIQKRKRQLQTSSNLPSAPKARCVRRRSRSAFVWAIDGSRSLLSRRKQGKIDQPLRCYWRKTVAPCFI